MCFHYLCFLVRKIRNAQQMQNAHMYILTLKTHRRLKDIDRNLNTAKQNVRRKKKRTKKIAACFLSYTKNETNDDLVEK